MTVRVISALMLTEGTEGIRAIALPFLVYGGVGNLSAASVVAVSGAVPAVLVGIFGSPQVERLSRQRIIVVSNVVRAALLLGLPFMWQHAGLVAVVAVSFVSASLGALEQPAMYASLPVLFEDDYQAFLGKRVGFSFLVQAIGPAIGGLLVGILGPSRTIFLCGLLYAVYALVIGSIRGFDAGHAQRSECLRGRTSMSMVREAFAVARSIPALRTLYIFWFFSLAAVPIGVLSAVPYISTTLGLTSVEYGIASACYGTATVISSFVAGKLKFRGGARRWLIGSGVVYGTANLLMGFEPGFAVFCVLWFVWGIAYGPEEVLGQLVFVRSAPAELQGRLFALMTVVMTSGMLVGDAVVGPISDSFGPQWAMVTAGVLFLGATLASFGFGKGARAIGEVDVTSSA